jgi:hypothetical protein
MTGCASRSSVLDGAPMQAGLTFLRGIFAALGYSRGRHPLCRQQHG